MIDFERVCNKNLYSIHLRTTQKAETSAWFMHQNKKRKHVSAKKRDFKAFLILIYKNCLLYFK